MSRFDSLSNDVIYDAGEAWRDRCLRDDRSLLFGDEIVWTLDNLDGFHERLVEHLIAGTDQDFFEKLKLQLNDAPEGVTKLAAELILVYGLFPSVIFLPDTKRQMVRTALDLGGVDPGTIDEASVAWRALGEEGIGNPGGRYNMRRHNELRYLIDFSRAFKNLPSEQRTELLGGDPWAFQDWLDELENEGGPQSRHIILHLLWPDYYERIASAGHKARIVAANHELLDAGLQEADVDRQLYAIRQQLSQSLDRPERELDFYATPELNPWREAGNQAADDTRSRVAHEAVEAALDCLAALPLSPRADSSLRVLLAFKAIWAERGGDESEIDGAAVKAAVEELFQLLPGPKEFPGTISLRGSGGKPNWLTNDSYRGSFIDYAGPNRPGRTLFEDGDWRRPLRANAVEQVAQKLATGNEWPPRDVLAAIVLRDAPLDTAASWHDLIDMARMRFGLSADEFAEVTSDPVLDEVDPLTGDPWNPRNLAPVLRPAGGETPLDLDELPAAVRVQVERVLDVLRQHGDHSIVALSGVPRTSKSYVARIAARAFASPGSLREIQFSPGYTYEEFMEGPRLTADGMEPVPGALLDLNNQALLHPDRQFVLLIEELTRADLPKVLGEFLTYVEYRGDQDHFATMYTRDKLTRIAPNLAVLGTYNPADRSAVSLDAAIIGRMRILSFPPNLDLLEEILLGNGLDQAVIGQLIEMFEACRNEAGPDRFEEVMPFGHSAFSGVESEEDLYDLWQEELRFFLQRPRTPRHELYDTIVAHYPWYAGPTVTVVTQAARGTGHEGGDEAEDEAGGDVVAPSPDESDGSGEAEHGAPS